MLGTLAAPVVFSLCAPAALSVLDGVEFGVGGTRGILQLTLGAGFQGGMLAAGRGHRLLRAAAALAVLAAFILLFPLPGLAFAAVSLALGAGTERFRQPWKEG